MSTIEQTPLAQVKNRLSEVVEHIEREHGRVVITKHGAPAAVNISIEDLESLEESLRILSDPLLVAEIRRSTADVAQERVERLTKEQALALIDGR